MKNAPDITCVVPTHNRAPFLRRWLKFYADFAPGFEVLVADSSRPEALAENSALLREGVCAVRVRHITLDLDFIGKIRQALELVETPLVTLCADDDLVLPDAVRQSAEFLAGHRDYASVQGRTAKVYPRRFLFGCDRLKGFSIEDDDPLVRSQRLARNWFTNFYAVYRTETLREMFRLTERNVDALAEMFLSQLSAIRGRIKVLPCLHLILEVHPGAAGVQCRGVPWTDAEAQFQRFRACLVSELASAGTDPQLAGVYIDQQFIRFRNPNLRNPRRSAAQWLRYWGQSSRERLEDWFHEVDVRHKRPICARDIGDARTVWRSALTLMRTFPNGIPAD